MDSVAPDPDARTHGVNPGLGGTDGNLAAETGFTGDGLDLNHAVIDLRNLDLKQPFEHVLVASGDENLRSLGRASDADQVDLGALPLTVALVGGLFFVREHCLGAAQVQSDGAARFGLFNHA